MSAVGLVKRVLTTNGRRYCPVVVAANGRISPDKVVVNGAEMRYPAGTYYIEWWEGPSRKRLAAGKDATQAQAQRLRKQTQLEGKARGLTVTDASSTGQTSLSDSCAVYLEDTRLSKSIGTLNAYRVSLDYFQQSCGKKYVEEITRRDLLEFAVFVRDQKKGAPATVCNKFGNVMSFLKAQGVSGILKKGDRPKKVTTEAEVYERDMLEQLHKACSKPRRLLYDFLLMSGVREQEATYMEWPNINFQEKSVSVRWKPQYLKYGWRPKNYRERTIPVPDKLIKDLKEAKLTATCALVFPTRSCTPQRDMLRNLKRDAKRAQLDPSDFWLHRFRASFCTWHLWAGVDIVTVQSWMGHTDLKSTMAYLKPNRGQAVRDKVNLTFG